MTTIPGHNIIIQQAGIAREASQQARPLQPDLEQLAAQQAVKEAMEKGTVQETLASEKTRTDQEEAKKRQQRQKLKKRLNKKKIERDQTPDAPGSLLNTVV